MQNQSLSGTIPHRETHTLHLAPKEKIHAPKFPPAALCANQDGWQYKRAVRREEVHIRDSGHLCLNYNFEIFSVFRKRRTVATEIEAGIVSAVCGSARTGLFDVSL